MINTNINFGGFYYSLHDSLIDNMINSYFDYNDELIDSLEIDYKTIQNEYIKEYLFVLDEFIRDEFLEPGYKKILFHDVKLISPTFYNYTTDTINVNISNYNAKVITNLFIDDEDFYSYLKEKIKSFDGYISFYTFDEVIANKDDMLISYVFDYITSELLDDETFLNYYDLNNVYELLYNINDFYKEEIAS